MKDLAGTIESVMNKVFAFVLYPFIRSILSATRSSIHFFEFWQQPSVTLVLTSRDPLEEESRGLLGSVLMQKFHQAILQRQRLPEKERFPLSIYADESHEYYTPEGTPWFGTVVMPKDPPEQDEHAYRLESAKHHAKPLQVIAEEEKARIDRLMKAAQAELYASPPKREPQRRRR